LAKTEPQSLGCEKMMKTMKHIFYTTFVLLVFVSILAAQERNYESMQQSTMFRGKVLMFESKKNPDGTYTDTYRDISGNPMTETERNFIDGLNKLTAANAWEERGITSEGDATSSLLIHVYGDNPEFREFTGMTLEQVRDIYVTQWNMLGDHPSDEMLDFCVRAAKTDNSEEVERISAEMMSYLDEEFKKIGQSVAEILSPEQMQKLWELEWAMRPKIDFDRDSNTNNTNPINFTMYNALALDRDQQRRLEIFKKEYVQARLELHKSSSLTERQKWDKNKELAESMRSKLSAMLTASQRTKLEQIWGNKPKFMMPNAPPPQKTEEDYEFLKAWKPGDPVPEGRLPPPPTRRFPR